MAAQSGKVNEGLAPKRKKEVASKQTKP